MAETVQQEVKQSVETMTVECKSSNVNVIAVDIKKEETAEESADEDSVLA